MGKKTGKMDGRASLPSAKLELRLGRGLSTDLGTAARPAGLKQSGSGGWGGGFWTQRPPSAEGKRLCCSIAPSPNCWGHPKDEPRGKAVVGRRRWEPRAPHPMGCPCIRPSIRLSIQPSVQPASQPSSHPSIHPMPAVTQSFGCVDQGLVNAEHPLKGRDVPGSQTSHPNPLKMGAPLPTIPSHPTFPCPGVRQGPPRT